MLEKLLAGWWWCSWWAGQKQEGRNVDLVWVKAVAAQLSSKRDIWGLTVEKKKWCKSEGFAKPKRAKLELQEGWIWPQA